MKGKEKEKMHKDIHEKYLRIYDQQSDAIFRHCYFRVSDREIALDIMHDTFTKTWEYVAKGNEVKNIKAFLYKVANNLLIDYYRKKKATSLNAIEDQGIEFAAEGAGNSIKRNVDVGIALQYLEGLDDAHKQVLIMRYVDDMRVKDIAEVLNEKENAVSVRIHRAINKVQDQINKKYE